MSKTTLCVLFGGCTSEYEVSLESAYGVISNIDRAKYAVVMVAITNDGIWNHYTGDVEDIPNGKWVADTANLKRACVDVSMGSSSLIVFGNDGTFTKIRIDAAFPVMHGAYGEDGTMQGLFEMAKIPFVGSGCASSAACMDKAMTKMIINNTSVPQAKSLIRTIDMKKLAQCDEYTSALVAEIEAKFTYPIFIKPANAGSSRGISKVTATSSLIDALILGAENDAGAKVIIEENISGKEVEVAVLGNPPDIITSVCGEIDPGSEFYDYDTKYKNSTASYFIPARIKPETADKIKEYVTTIYTALGCKGLSRVDFFVGTDSAGNEIVTFNEINTIPGFTPISMYPKLFIHSDISYAELIDRLVTLAMGNGKGDF